MSAPQPPRRVSPRLLAGLVVPLIAFFVLLGALGNATGALAITDAIPLLWVVVHGVRQRRIEPVGAFALVVFSIALVLTVVLHGSSLPLELRRSVFPGTVGLACLISLAARRPLLYVAATRVRDARPQGEHSESRLDSPGARRSLATMTAIIGVTGTADAIAQIVLALTLSTAAFVVAARIASYVIIGAGLAVGVVYVRRTPGPPGAHPLGLSSGRSPLGRASRGRECLARQA